MKIKALTFILFFTSFYFIFLKPGVMLVFNGGNPLFFADKITKICSKESYRPGCYDREIPKLMLKGFATMEQAFAVTSQIQQKDTVYLYCHVLGHELSDIETRKNPDKWLDVITRCPTLACNNGCAHGAIMRRFKGSEVLSESQVKELLPDLNIACEPRGDWQPSELEISMCYHSIGHLAMYITDADIDRSIDICKKVGIKGNGKNYYQTCLQGVFMIIFQHLDQEDIALVSKIKPEKDKVDEFCSRFKDLEFAACHVETWPYFSEELGTPTGIHKFCSYAKTDFYKKWCYDDAALRGGFSVRLLESSGVDGVAKFCMTMPSDIRGRCFPSIATAWVQDEPHYAPTSMSLCEEAGKYGFSDQCYKGLLFFSKFSFNKGSAEWNEYCSTFPEEYKSKCISGDVPESW